MKNKKVIFDILIFAEIILFWSILHQNIKNYRLQSRAAAYYEVHNKYIIGSAKT